MDCRHITSELLLYYYYITFNVISESSYCGRKHENKPKFTKVTCLNMKLECFEVGPVCHMLSFYF